MQSGVRRNDRAALLRLGASPSGSPRHGDRPEDSPGGEAKPVASEAEEMEGQLAAIKAQVRVAKLEQEAERLRAEVAEVLEVKQQEADVGLGRIVALYYRPSASYQIN